MAWVHELPGHDGDALVLTGNIATSLSVLSRALRKLKRRFKYCFYVFGNSDLWINAKDIRRRKKRAETESMLKEQQGPTKRRNRHKTDGIPQTPVDEYNSIEKFFDILDLCDSLGIITCPALLGESLAIVPLFSWYNIPGTERPGNRTSTGGGVRVEAKHTSKRKSRRSSIKSLLAKKSSALRLSANTNRAHLKKASLVKGKKNGQTYLSQKSKRLSPRLSLLYFNMQDQQCKWPNAIADAAPAKFVPPINADDSRKGIKNRRRKGGTQNESVNERAPTLETLVAGAAAFFHELNREAMAIDYGNRRVITFSHFTPHAHLLEPSVRDAVHDLFHSSLSEGKPSSTSATSGTGTAPPSRAPSPQSSLPLSCEVESLCSAAHAYGQGDGRAVSKVVAL